MDPHEPLRHRIRWGNLAWAAAALGVVVLVIAWPRVGAREPDLPAAPAPAPHPTASSPTAPPVVAATPQAATSLPPPRPKSARPPERARPRGSTEVGSRRRRPGEARHKAGPVRARRPHDSGEGGYRPGSGQRRYRAGSGEGDSSGAHRGTVGAGGGFLPPRAVAPSPGEFAPG